MTNPRIQDATDNDLRFVAHLHTRSQADAYAHLLAPGTRFDVDTAHAHWQTRMAAPGTRRLLLALAAGDSPSELAGFGLLTREPFPWATINALHVRPDLRGAGIGTALLDALLVTAGQWDRTHAYLHVIDANALARAFYTHRGWSLAGPGPDHTVAGHRFHTCRYHITL